VTWLYRLTVFFAIALLMYFLFFKLLGIVLMALELVWFIFRPVWTEATYLWRKRAAISLAWKPTLLAAALVALGVWLVPVASEVSAPGIYRAANEQAVYAPFPARVVSVEVSPGQQVIGGELLVSLEAQGMKVRAVKAEVAITSARAELARTPASVRQQERRSVLEQQLAEALAGRQSVVEEAANEQLRATHAGTVREVQPDMVPGRWVNPRQVLFRVVSESEPLIEAYVGEQQVEAIRPGQRVRFYADLPHFPVVRATVISVDRTPLKEISRPLLASVHGGEIVVTHDAKGPLFAREAVFRVNAKPDGSAPKAVTMVRGTLRIETDIRLVAENFVSRTLSLLISESGF
jgi:putative peptide zinc metalloprotease protein